MARLDGAWDGPALADFLDSARIPVRLACRTPAGRLWMVSLWFTPTDGDPLGFACATSARARLVAYLRADAEVAFEISTNQPPYRGVRGVGTAAISTDTDKALLGSLLERYLGGTDSDLATRLLAPERREVRIDVTADRLYTWDFTGRMPARGED